MLTAFTSFCGVEWKLGLSVEISNVCFGFSKLSLGHQQPTTTADTPWHPSPKTETLSLSPDISRRGGPGGALAGASRVRQPSRKDRASWGSSGGSGGASVPVRANPGRSGGGGPAPGGRNPKALGPPTPPGTHIGPAKHECIRDEGGGGGNPVASPTDGWWEGMQKKTKILR